MNNLLKEKYLSLFNVTVPQLDTLVGTALCDGGGYCDLYFEYTTYDELVLRDSEVSSGGFHTDYGVGIRVLCNDKTGYAYSENTDMADMTAAAKVAGAIARGSINPGKPFSPDTAPSLPADGFYPCTESWRETSSARFIPFLKKLETAILRKDNRVVKVFARMSDSQSDIMMYNSLGELVCDSRPMCSVAVSAVFSWNGESDSKTSSRSFRKDPGMINDELIEELSNEVVSGIDARFEAKRPKGGKMSVVMGAGASGILLHEAMGHAFEADFNRKGQSVFSDKFGKKICGADISICDDATLPFNRGSLNYDDEGIRGQQTWMVTDGLLTSYLHDRISARYYGVAPTGNGRRENFRYNPIPRMRATYMKGGNASPEDILASVKKGIYVDEFANGQVKIGEGDFTFYVKSGFLIENGRLTMPVKDINVIGNGPEALADIIAVGNDLKIDNGTWTCGKEQSAPVTCGIPTVLVNSLTVGGE